MIVGARVPVILIWIGLTLSAFGCSTEGDRRPIAEDTTAPAAIEDLHILGGQACIGYFTLEWTATGDDSLSGTAAAYDLRHNRTGFAGEEQWIAAAILTGMPQPREAGTQESFEVHGLEPGFHFFAIKARDEAGNWSPLSPVVLGELCAADTMPPAAVEDLRIDPFGSGPTRLRLRWTATGDDGTVGTAATYDLRHNLIGFQTESDWASAALVEGLASPAPAGSEETVLIEGLATGTTHHFALKVQDESGLLSALSNVASGSTSPSNRWRVDGDGSADFRTIAGAIDAAADGDTIDIAPGIYSDTLVVAGRSLVLLGSGPDTCLLVHTEELEPLLTVTAGSELQISGLTFRQGVTNCGNGVVVVDSETEFDQCVLVHCGLSSTNSELIVRRSTIDGQCLMWCDEIVPFVHVTNGQVRFERCILSPFSGGTSYAQCQNASVTFLCCDLAAEMVGCGSPLGIDGNFSADPLYWDPALLDLRLQPGSPCLPENTPAGCDLVGALGAGN